MSWPLLSSAVRAADSASCRLRSWRTSIVADASAMVAIPKDFARKSRGPILTRSPASDEGRQIRQGDKERGRQGGTSAASPRVGTYLLVSLSLGLLVFFTTGLASNKPAGV